MGDLAEKLRLRVVVDHSKTSCNCCIFCLKSASAAKLKPEEVINRSRELLKKFLTLVGRYFDGGGVSEDVQFDLSICEDCEIIVESWTTIYHKIKCLEMELEWKILKLKDVMSSASRVPARMTFFKECYPDDENLGQWRNKLIKKCKLKLTKGAPRVSVSKLDKRMNALTSYGVTNESNCVTTSASKESNNVLINDKSATAQRPFEVKSLDEDNCAARRSQDSNMEMIISPVHHVKSDVDLINMSHTYFIDMNEKSANVISSPAEIEVESEPEPMLESVDSEVECKNDALFEKSQETNFNSVCPLLLDIVLPLAPLSPQTISANNEGDTSATSLIICSSTNVEDDISHSISRETQGDINVVQDNSPSCNLNVSEYSESENVTIQLEHKCSEETTPQRGQGRPPPTKSPSMPPLPLVDTPSLTSSLRSRFRCLKCGKTFSTFEKLNTHGNLHANISEDSASDHSAIQSDEEWVDDGKNNENDNASEKSDVVEDDDKLSNSKIIENIIDSDIHSASHLNIKIYDRKTFWCENCGRKFHSMTSYTKHCQALSLKKHCVRLDCFICGKECGEREKLESHTRTHTQERPFFCHSCDYSFSTSNALSLHTLSKHFDDFESSPHSDNGENSDNQQSYNDKDIHRFYKIKVSSKNGKSSWFRCGVCKHKLETKQGFNIHYRVHHKHTSGRKVYKCKEDNCSAYFRQPHQLHSHMVTHHRKKGGTATKVFACSICSMKFVHLNFLKYHKRIKHNNGNVEDKKVMKCECDLNKCTAYFLTCAQLSNHVLHCHPKSEVKPYYLCDLCPTELPSLKALKHHVKTQHKQKFMMGGKVKYYHPSGEDQNGHKREYRNFIKSEASKVCSICGWKFYKPCTLRAHQKTHHTSGEGAATSYKCKQEGCPAYFRTGLQLRFHTTHGHLNAPASAFPCEYCGKQLKKSSTLSIHRLKFHKLEELQKLNFSCNHEGCDKKYVTQEELSLHLKFGHRGPRQICPTCGRSCFSETQFARHVKSHEANNRKKTYVCDLCGKHCKNTVVLKFHQLSHSGPDSWEFQCSTCGRKCLTKHKLAEHLRTHSKEKPFICQYCGEKYAHNHNLRNHVKSKHGDVVN